MTNPDRLRLFAVEDEALIALELRDMLEDLGHEVVGMGASVERALAALERLPAPPDVAIVDLNLGGSSALPVIEALRARSVPVLVTTGYGAPEVAAMGVGEPVVRKPYAPRDIAQALDRLCANGRG